MVLPVKTATRHSGTEKREALVQVFSCEFCKKYLEHHFYRTSPGDCFCTGTNFTIYHQADRKRAREALIEKYLTVFFSDAQFFET